MLPGERAAALDSGVTFAELFASLAVPSGRRCLLPFEGFFLVRALLAARGDAAASRGHSPHEVADAVRALDELRGAGITAGHFAHVPPHARLSSEAGAVVALLGAYERALAAGNLFDDADRQREAVLAVATGKARHAVALRRVMVEGGGAVVGSRLDLLRALAARGVDVCIRVPFDAQRRAAFALGDATLHYIESAAAEAHLTLVHDDRVGTGPLAKLRRVQFTDETAPGAPVSLLRAASVFEHGALAASSVSRWLAAGTPPQAIAVATRDMEGMGRAVVAALTDRGIAAHLRAPRRLSAFPAARVVMGALELADADFARERFIDLWRALDRVIDTPAGPFSPERVATLLRQAGVRSTRVNDYGPTLAAFVARQAGHASTSGLAAALESVQAALRRVQGELAALPEQGSVAAQLAAAERLASSLVAGMGGTALATDLAGEKLLALRPLLDAEVASSQARDAVLELLQALGRAASDAAAHTLPMSRRELAVLVRFALTTAHLAAPAAAPGSVEVLALEQLVEAHYDKVVLVGIDGGVWPRAARRDALLSEDVRVELNRLVGPRLVQASATSGREALSAEAQETWLYLEALASCEQELVATASVSDSEPDSELWRELARSTGLEVSAAVPSYAIVPEGRAQARRAWAYAAHAPGPRLFAAPLGLAQALEASLPAGERARLADLDRRQGSAQVLGAPPFRLQLLGAAERQVLSARLLGRAQASSRLDLLGMCIFRYFAAAGLGLALDDEVSLGPSAREEGTAAHAALEVVYQAVRAQGGLAALRTDPARAQALAEAALASAEARILAETMIHPLRRAAALHDARQAALLRLQIDLDRGVGEPLALEHRFDDSPRAAGEVLELDDPAGERTLRVRGSIDRIDRIDDSGAHAESLLEVIDYKRSVKKRSSGRHFQLPIYLEAALRDFGAGITCASASWYDLRRGKTTPGVDEDSPVALRARLRTELWGRLDRLLVEGDTAPDPDTAELCARCDFAPLCRFAAVAGDDGGAGDA